MIKEMLLAAETLVLDFLSKYSDVVAPDPVLAVYREWYGTGKLSVRQLEDDESFLDLISYWAALISIWEVFVVWTSWGLYIFVFYHPMSPQNDIWTRS